MNEKIRKLAKQAGFYFYDMHDVDGQDLGESVEADSFSAVEKFAELIVRECAKVSERTGALNGADYEGEMIADAIKEHFGVEE